MRIPAATISLAVTLAIGIHHSSLAQVADHLECYKIKDSAAKTSYTANLNGLVVEPGCRISLPAKLLCVDTSKTSVVPPAPVSGDGSPESRVLCYKVKCAKNTLPAVNWRDQFGARSVRTIASKYVCAPELPAPTTTTTFPPGANDVVINEVVAEAVAASDWIELFNRDSAPVDLSGWTLTDNAPTHVFTFADGTILLPGAYLVLDENAPGSFTFGLGTAGDAVNLYDDGAALIDSTSWTSGQADAPTSWGRSPNATGSFQTLATPTKGSANP